MILFKGKRESAAVYLFDLVLLLWFLEVVYPPLNALPVKRAPVCVACAFASVFLYLVLRISRKGTLPLKVLFVLSAFLLIIVLPYLFGNGVIGNRYLALSLVFFGPIIFEFYRENGLLGHLKVILYIVGAFAVVTGIITYYHLLATPYISRSIKYSRDSAFDLERQGIGGYWFVYFVSAVAIPLLYVFLAEKKKLFKKWLCFFLFLFCLVFVVKSNFMTAFLATFFCALLMVFFNFARGRGIRGRLILLFALIAFFFAALNVDKLLMQLEGFFPKRIARVLYSGEENVLQSIFTEFMEDRWWTIQTSLDSFVEHPFLGLCFSGKMVYDSEGFLAGFGQHSYIADSFALFGILFGAFCTYAALRPVRFYRGERVNCLSVAMFICTISLLLFNNATESIALVIGIVYPLVRELYREPSKETLNELPRGD